MQLASLLNSALPQRVDAIAGALRAWSQGLTLEASVVRVANGQALLQINGQQVLAQTRMPLIVGQTLRLQVDKAGTQPQLRVLDSSGGAAGASAHAAVTSQANGNGQVRGALLQILNSNAPQAPPAVAAGASNTNVPIAPSEALAVAVLRGALPQRQSLVQSMSVLEQFVATARSTGIHPALERARTMAADFLHALPRPQDAADANRLRAMVQRSGLFHEAHLLQRSTSARHRGADIMRAVSEQQLLNPPAADMKARLMALAESLGVAMRGAARGDARGELAAGAVRGAVSNIEANQVASVRGSEQANGSSSAHNNAQASLWRLDLPFVDARGYQALQLRVDREPRGRWDGAAAPSWIAQLLIQAPGEAPLHARITLNGATVYTTFSTDDDALAEQIEHGESALGELLDTVHLALGGMSLQRTAVTALEDTSIGAALVSEHA